jgi:hypothetical protein
MAPGVCLREGGGAESEILGPDFMILDGDDYINCDAKPNRRRKPHEILLRFNSTAGCLKRAAERAQGPVSFQWHEGSPLKHFTKLLHLG